MDDFLIVDQFGAFIGKHSERIRISLKGEVISEQPFYGLEHLLIVAEGVSLSSDVIRECVQRGIQLSFLSYTGTPYARLISPELTGTIKTRREQLMAYLDRRGVILGKAFASGKTANQSVLLKYMSKYRKDTAVELYEKAREAADRIDDLTREIQELEGEKIDDLSLWRRQNL